MSLNTYWQKTISEDILNTYNLVFLAGAITTFFSYEYVNRVFSVRKQVRFVPGLCFITFGIMVIIAEFIHSKTLKTALFLVCIFLQGAYMKIMCASMSRIVFYLSSIEIKSAYSMDSVASILSSSIVLFISFFPVDTFYEV